MINHSSSLNQLWGSLIVEELIRNGINYFCISPGSRSAPLTIAVSRNPCAKSIICFDERSAAFHALGYARAQGKPAVVVTTSGTAVANCFPAVLEAAMDALPLLVLSADRPPELLENGANQTIQQVNIFGEYVRWQFTLPCPDENITPQMVLTTVDHAVYMARRAPAGPVHLNCRFREPLAPVKKPFAPTYTQILDSWVTGHQPYTSYTASVLTLPLSDLQALAGVITQTHHGLMIAGRMQSEEEIKAVSRLASALNWPVFADITSGLRCGRTSIPNMIHYFDQLLLSERFKQYLHPDTILHIGAPMTSKRFLQYLEENHPQHYIVVENHPFRHDPAHAVTTRIETHLPAFCESLLALDIKADTTEWFRQMSSYSQKINSIIDQYVAERKSVNEISVTRHIWRSIPSENGLFLASSMPIRDMDMFADTNGTAIKVGANRGASGIDGTIASAAGFAVGLDQPVTLLIGDLAFIHDLNSLTLLKKSAQPLIIVVINNHGGGIFSFVPIAKFKDVFEPYFATPHDLEFAPVAQCFEIDFYCPNTNEEFILAYQAALEKKQSAIIEIRTDRQENYAIHQELEKKIMAAIF